MMKIYKIPLVIGIGFWLTLVLSCDNKQEPKKTVVTPPIVVSKAIAKPSSTLKNPKAISPTQPMMTPGKTVAEPAKPKIPGTSAKAETKPSPSQPTPVTEAQAKREQVLAAAGTSGISQQAKEYDSQGRVDPFIPLLSEKPQPMEPGAGDNKPKRILTPLEKLDLSQIKLVAVVRLKGRAIAMVEESSGKGYEVGIGTYMGRNGGQVSSINPEGIVVKEYVKDYKGKRKERFQEIKFHKKNGE